MAEPPVDRTGDLLYFTGGTLAYAGHYLHQDIHPVHTHSFIEIAVVTSGEGVHVSLAGRQDLTVGDVILLRPGVWHGYEMCRDLDVFNCCFSVELLERELAWMREDPILNYLMWTGPYSAQRRGMLTTRLGPDRLKECVEHLDALDGLRFAPLGVHRGDIVGRVALFLSGVARAVTDGSSDLAGQTSGASHPAVVAAMRLLDAAPERQWTLADLAGELHLARGYVVRLFKSATGLPPMAYLARHRVELAATLLLHSDQSITQIGEAVGWADASLFARRFKAHFGLSATTYRERFSHNAGRLRPWHQPT